jgi:hypothetical protein
MSEQSGIPGGMRPPLIIDDVNSVPWIDSADVVVAVRLCSRGYISGVSIADCVFSGRRAGSAAARLGA